MTAKFTRNEHGIITRVVENPTKKFHKGSEEKYPEIIQEQKKNALAVEQQFETHLNKVKSKILSVCTLNINNTIDYYFNNETGRTDAHQDELFIQSLKQIYSITRLFKDDTNFTAQTEIIMTSLKALKRAITEQRKFVLRIQDKMLAQKNEKTPTKKAVGR